jgi:hypothetical protein
MDNLDTLRFVSSLQTAKKKSRRQAQRDRDNGLRKIALIFVLMQRQSRARLIPIDKARIRGEVWEACFLCGSYGELLKCRGHTGPGTIHLWVDPVVSIAGSISNPPK